MSCRFQQPVEVAGDQRPGVTGRIGVGENLSAMLDALLSVAVILKNRSVFNAPNDGVVQGTGAFIGALRGMKLG